MSFSGLVVTLGTDAGVDWKEEEEEGVIMGYKQLWEGGMGNYLID